MKITIDTKTDSHEEIRKIIAMLSSLVEAQQFQQEQLTQQQQQEAAPAIFDMFGQSSAPLQENKQATSFGSAAPARAEHTAEAEGGTSEEVFGFFSENKEEEVRLPEQKVVENVVRKSRDENVRVVPY